MTSSWNKMTASRVKKKVPCDHGHQCVKLFDSFETIDGLDRQFYWCNLCEIREWIDNHSHIFLGYNYISVTSTVVQLNYRWSYPDSKVHGANMGPIWGRRTQVGPIFTPRTLLSGWALMSTYIILCTGNYLSLSLSSLNALHQRAYIVWRWSVVAPEKPYEFQWNNKSLAPEKTQISNFESHIKDRYLQISCEIALKWLPQTLLMISQRSTGLGNVLVPSGNKQSSEPMLTHISVAIWCH